MICLPLLKREIKVSYKLVLIFAAVLTMYSGIIISMYDPKLGSSLTMMMESMPELFTMFGMQNPGTTLLDFLVNYLYGFLFLVFPIICTIILSNKLVAAYVDKGSAAYLLATPNSRKKIITTQILVLLCVVVFLIAFVTALCIGICQVKFSGQLDIWGFVKLNLGLLGLHVFLAGLFFFFSCISNVTRTSLGLSTACAVGFLLIQMVSQVGDKFQFLKYITPLSLFSAKGIVAGEPYGLWGVLVLYSIGIALCIIGGSIFTKRDLSL